MILEHLDAACEAARSVGEGNDDVPRLETHVWNAYDELITLVHDKQRVDRYAAPIAQLVGALDRLKQSHPEVIATLNAGKQIDHLRGLGK